MNYKTLEDRLEIYKTALDDYKAGEYRFLKCGFCWYFTKKYNLGDGSFYSYFNLMLPELFKTKPASVFDAWFPDGELQPRIACLTRAIKITENKIKKQEKTLAK